MKKDTRKRSLACYSSQRRRRGRKRRWICVYTKKANRHTEYTKMGIGTVSLSPEKCTCGEKGEGERRGEKQGREIHTDTEA